MGRTPQQVPDQVPKYITFTDNSPSGKYLATGTSDGNISIISAQSLRTLFQVKAAHSIFVTDLQFTPDEKFLASVSVDSSILLTNLASVPADSGRFLFC